MKKIVIPADFSKATENALIAAKEIAQKTMSEVILLHCIDAPYEPSFNITGEIATPDIMDRVFVHKSLEVSNKKMKNLLNDPRFAGMRLHPHIKIAKKEKDFIDFLNHENADLIIIGTQEHHHLFKGFLHGKHASMTISDTNCMVLTVKNIQADFHIRNLVFATNFEEDAPFFIEQIKNLQSVFDFSWHIIYIHSLLNNKKSVDEVMEEKKQFIKKYAIEEHHFEIIDDFTEYQGIVKYARKANADLLALTTHHRSGFHILGGISNDLVEETNYPVLTCRSDL